MERPRVADYTRSIRERINPMRGFIIAQVSSVMAWAGHRAGQPLRYHPHLGAAAFIFHLPA
jgi:hypothetical protein